MPHDATDSITRRTRTNLATGPESATSDRTPGADGLSIPDPACACSCRAKSLPHVRKQPSDVAMRRCDSAARVGTPARPELYHALKRAVKPMLRLEFSL